MAAPDTTTDAPEQPTLSDEAYDFRDRIDLMIHALGREGYKHALETLFAISDLVLDNRYCAEHTVRRIREILRDAKPESSSEEESAETG